VVGQADLFAQVREFPDPDAHARFAALVGIDDVKARLTAEASLLIDPEAIERWSNQHHDGYPFGAKEVARRTPLIVLAGDVGTGKTELAESFGDAVARSMQVDVTLYPLSLSARGKGAVGEMTSLLTAAFNEVRAAGAKARNGKGRVSRGLVLLIDEADALAQSRELAQMHHEDRAGVNTLVRGIDSLRSDNLPVLTVMCTNRLEALDPAVTRRAAVIFTFERPGDEQRRVLLEGLLDGFGISATAVDTLVELTGPRAGRAYGATYSDIRQRLVPGAVLRAFSSSAPLTGPGLIDVAKTFEPTRPFGVLS
jgi:AAA+ superfamily predicted ATPase